jgi:hypothetical protein
MFRKVEIFIRGPVSRIEGGFFSSMEGANGVLNELNLKIINHIARWILKFQKFFIYLDEDIRTGISNAQLGQSLGRNCGRILFGLKNSHKCRR